MSFASFPEQEEAKRLLAAALAEGPAHAYLFHGPAGVGKRRAAYAFAGELIGDAGRVERRTHPDLYVLEPLGDQVLIDEIRALRRDLHLRPFEARAASTSFSDAHMMNEAAADALLRTSRSRRTTRSWSSSPMSSGRFPETIRSRCQLVPFRRLSESAVRAEVLGQAPGIDEDELSAIARLAAGRLDRAARLLDPDGRGRRDALLEVARSVYVDDAFDPGQAARTLLDGIKERGARARTAAEETVEALELTAREADQRVRRAQRRAERDELLASLEELGRWYRDLIATAVGAEGAVVHSDRLQELVADCDRGSASREPRPRARPCARRWRSFEEFNIAPQLALEALLIRLHRNLAPGAIVAAV